MGQNGGIGSHGFGHFGGWRGRGRGRRGRRFHNFGDGPWMQQQSENMNDEEEEIEPEVFEFDEELVAILNMGFTKMSKIKKLLNVYQGNKERVVQELVAAK